jgi:hypothetical protein
VAAAAKPASRKRAVKPRKPAVTKKPAHPLMLDGQRWNKELVMAIVCERIATSNRSLPKLLAQGFQGNTLPSYVAINEWLAGDEKLATQYARAKRQQAEYLAEELMEIADDGENDWMESNAPNNPGWVANGEHLQRSKLRVDTRKWLMSKLLPKKYGDKQEVEHTGNVDHSLEIKFV